MKLILIAAIGKNNEIGYNNNLIWRISEDLKFFKKTTIGHSVLMGRKTYESLPKILDGRKNLVLSRSLKNTSEITIYKSKEEFLNDYKNKEENVFVIGGEQIYKLFIDECDEMYLTIINQTCENADAYFPYYNEEEFEIKSSENYEHNDLTYCRKIYVRKR